MFIISFFVTLILDDDHILHKIRFQPTERKGTVYASLVSYEVTTNPELMTFNFTNLFDGNNKELSDNIHAVLNEHWKEIHDDTGPQYDQAYAMIFKNYAERVFNKVPLNKIFLQ